MGGLWRGVREVPRDRDAGPAEGDTVAHCGPTLKGEFCRTLNLTDMRSGRAFTRSIRNNAHVHVLAALQQAVEQIPFEVTGLDFDNGSEFINLDVIGWAAERKIFFTRARPYKKNDQATIESKNNHLVRRLGFYWLDTENILAETGTDMTAFETPAHRASWAGVCPGQHESAGSPATSAPAQGTLT